MNEETSKLKTIYTEALWLTLTIKNNLKSNPLQ